MNKPNDPTDKKFTSPEEIQREFESFVKKKFGNNVQVVSHVGGFPGSHAESDEEETPRESVIKGLSFDYTPKQIKQHLDRFVIKQDDAKKALAIAVCDHYNQVFQTRDEGIDTSDYSKQNVLVLGPTGVGKTYLVKQIAKLIGVPFVKADATRFSETGYVGANVDDMVRDLVQQANGDIELAQYGIVYLDEGDKLASSTKGHKDVNGRGVQTALLKLMEETEVDLTAGNDIRSQMQSFMEFQQKGKVSKKIVNTKHILFIVSGAFSGLDDIIKKRMKQNDIGFGASQTRISDQDDLFNLVTTDDLVEYGFEPEFVGRLPVRVACKHLEEEDLFDILRNSEGSIIKQYKDSFKAYGIQAHFDESALHAIAKLAHDEKTGARALMTVCENSLREFKYELPSSALKSFVINDKTIEDPQGELTRLLDGEDNELFLQIYEEIDAFEQEFKTLYGMKISFNRHARDLIAKKLNEPTAAKNFCRDLLQSYEHGLKLIQQNTGQNEFVLAEDVVNDAKKTLERLIKESYGHNS